MHTKSLGHYILHHVMYVILFFFLISYVGFLAIRYTPGSLKQLQLGLSVNASQKEENKNNDVEIYREEFRYGAWIIGFVQGQWGKTEGTGQDIAPLIFSRLMVTLTISFFSWLSALFISTLIGVYHAKASVESSSTFSRVALAFYTWIELLLLSFTPLTLTILLLFIFQKLGLYITYLQNSGYKQALAFIMLFLLQVPYYRRMISTQLVTVVTRPYCIYARSLGYKYSRILIRHALPNIVSYVLHFAHIQFSFLLGASVIIEYILGIQGIGSLTALAAHSRERRLAIALLMIVGAIVFLYREVSEAMRYIFERRASNYV